MGFIDDELREISRFCENVIDNTRLICCLRNMVRVEITKTAFKKIIVCIQFPKNYPSSPLLIELKSKTLSMKLLNGLTEVCEKECISRLLDKSQVLPILKFIRNFIDENPLVCCYEEISSLKQLLQERDECKLKQKNSTVILTVCQDLYYFKLKLEVPDDYPDTSVILKDIDTNFPPMLTRYLVEQGKELGRQCVEAPLTKEVQQMSFVSSPSLHVVASFLIKTVKTLVQERCQLCRELCLPRNPKNVIIDENADLHIERLYCGHLFHLQCFVTFMKTPPFHGGKNCPRCGQHVYHKKWGLSDKLAEDRWAHQQARARELAEVEAFFK